MLSWLVGSGFNGAIVRPTPTCHGANFMPTGQTTVFKGTGLVVHCKLNPAYDRTLSFPLIYRIRYGPSPRLRLAAIISHIRVTYL